MLLTEDHCDELTEFQCKYLYQCIPLDKVNDAAEDCLDRTDEGLRTAIICTVIVVT